MSLDISLFQAIHGLAHQSSAVDFLAIFLAKYLGYFLILVFILVLLLERHWQRRFYKFALGALSVILARGLVVEIIRFFYHRPRPGVVLSIETLIDTPEAFSFPSGHAAVFFALAMAVYYMNKRLGLWFLACAALISLARVLVGVHWPSDVIAGAIFGALSAVIAKKLLARKD